MAAKKRAIKNIRLDGDTQPRTGIDDSIVLEYSAAYKAGAKFPPIIVFFDGKDTWLADGFHRWHAARKAGLKQIDCDVQTGTMQDARWFCLSANQTHGVRRTNEDKALAVKRALKHPNGAGLSDRQIAEHVGVSHATVIKYRADLESTGQVDQSPTRTGRDGRTIDTSNIGRKAKEADSDDTAVCPNCGSTDFDDDGDCAKCHEPGVVVVDDDEPEVEEPAPDPEPAEDPKAKTINQQAAGDLRWQMTETISRWRKCVTSDHHGGLVRHADCDVDVPGVLRSLADEIEEMREALAQQSEGNA